MVPASNGQSQQRERAADWGSASQHPSTPFPPLTLTKKGHRLLADSQTLVTPNYFCLMHKLMLLFLWTEKVKYSQAANNNNKPIDTLSFSFITAAVVVVAQVEEHPLNGLWKSWIKCWQCWVRTNMSSVIKTACLCCIHWQSLSSHGFKRFNLTASTLAFF